LYRQLFYPRIYLAENELAITQENINWTEDELGVNNTKSVSFVMADATPEENPSNPEISLSAGPA
jgi:hypothetical protein